MVDLVWRTATATDAPALAQLQTEINAVTGIGHPRTPAEVEYDWTQGRCSTNTTRLAFEGTRLLAWGTLVRGPSGGRRREIHGGVHPSAYGRGIGTELLTWLLDQGDPDWDPALACEARDIRSRRLFARFGFVPDRSFITMTRPSSLAVPAVHPTGFELVSYAPEYAERLWAAHQESFAAHYGFEPSTAERWLGRSVGHPQFRADLTWLAVVEEQVVGFSVAYGLDSPVLVGQVGTRTAWRGRGIATTALYATCRSAADVKLSDVELMVDSANGTGAVGLYERAGFAERSRLVMFSSASQPG